MDGDVLTRGREKGVSVWELAIGVLLVAAGTGAVTVALRGRLEAARGARAGLEMASILEGCRQYDALHGMWPVTWSQVREVLPGMRGMDPWGKPYIIASDEHRARVMTQAPGGLLTMSTGRTHGGAGRLAYEQRSAYAPR